jgi:hypothetical protein
VCVADLSHLVLEQVGLVAVQDAHLSGRERRCMRAGVHAVAGGFDADQRDPRIRAKGVEQADGIAAAADAGDARVGEPAGRLLHLAARLVPDDGLEVAHHQRVGMRTGHGADDVERVAHRGDPVA